MGDPAKTPLFISKQYKFGGTPDCIARIGSYNELLDWKTSNHIYPNYLEQIAAYVYHINHGVRMDNGKPLGIKVRPGGHLLRFAKEFPDFEHCYFGDLSVPCGKFKLLRQCYELDKELDRRVR